MADLDERFRSFSRTRSPDLWRDIDQREPGPVRTPSARHRALAIAVAFLVAAAGVGVAAITFGGSKADRTVAEPGPVVANGDIAFVSDGTAWMVQPDGSAPGKLTIDVPGSVGGLSWSPDGTRFVFDVNSFPEKGAPKGGYYDIYAANADGSNVVRLTHVRDARLPAWSPDGTRIAYTRQDGDGSQIYVMNADGSAAVALTNGSAFNVRPSWSPDGSRIAFESVAEGNADVYVMSADGSGLTRITTDPAGDYDPVWSLDGDIAFASDRSPSGIYVMRPDGSGVRLVESDGDIANLNLGWSPDGRLLAFSSSRGSGFARAVYVLDISSNTVTQVTDRGPIWGPSWQPIVEGEIAPAVTATVGETFSVGEDVRSVVYGAGSVWVAASNGDGGFGGQIVRIDPETHEVQAEIPVDVIPTWEVGGGAMVVEGDSLWVTGGLDAPGSTGTSDAAVIRIDTATNDVAETFDLGGEMGADLTFLDGEPWVLVFGDETADHRMEVVGVDPATGHITARIPLETGWAHSIVAADGRLVVLESGARATNLDGVAAAIYPETGAVARTPIPSDTFVPTPVVWRGQAWVGLVVGFAHFDPLRDAFPYEGPTSFGAEDRPCCGAIAADNRGIWFLGVDPDGGSDRRLTLFDPVTGEVAILATFDEGEPVAMAVSPDSLWILNYGGTLTRIELG